jgi:uncharacterized protein YaeQ
MALKSTVIKAELALSDMDRHHYQTYPLTLAQHPSETDERVMVRLLAFALHADEGLAFGGGLSSEEPALWQRNATGEILRWIEVGQPDEQLLRRACGRSREVVVYCYGARSAQVWWERNAPQLARLKNIQVWELSPASSAALAARMARNVKLQCLVQDGQASLVFEDQLLPVELTRWQ